jgi:hypothetical protein
VGRVVPGGGARRVAVRSVGRAAERSRTPTSAGSPHPARANHEGASQDSAAQFAEALAGTSWEEFLGSFEPVISQFLAKYRQLVRLADDDTERKIAEAYVAHELALASFVRRSLGHEPGEPLAEILALPHVAAALVA